MKKENLIRSICSALRAALRYWCSHADSLQAMKKLYARHYRDEKGENCMVLLGINPYGSIYRVSQLFYRGGVYSHEESWLATYGWHFNGHLTALGRSTCYVVFDPQQKTVCLETNDASDKGITELYTQV